MNADELDTLHRLLNNLEAEGLCYKDRSHCTPICPLWRAGAFGDDICLPNVLGRRVGRMARDKRLHNKSKISKVLEENDVE